MPLQMGHPQGHLTGLTAAAAAPAVAEVSTAADPAAAGGLVSVMVLWSGDSSSESGISALFSCCQPGGYGTGAPRGPMLMLMLMLTMIVSICTGKSVLTCMLLCGHCCRIAAAEGAALQQ